MTDPRGLSLGRDYRFLKVTPTPRMPAARNAYVRFAWRGRISLPPLKGIILIKK